MTQKEYCRVCKTEKGNGWDKSMIRKYGKCSKCLLEADLGHEYHPKTFICGGCNKELKTFKGFEKHKINCDSLLLTL